ncbi:transcription factor subunit Med10 of mediator complex-domain-containing protein [Bisporella sp. PMI_857]|nr:transcription factor subunit Med10 of mediator complex-domain-containing protein [Bisporella sp. PMI_857]
MPRLRIVYRRPPVEAHSVEQTDEDNEPPHDSSNDTEATNTPAQMAPAQIGHDQVEAQIQNILQDLYTMMMQIHAYDTNLPSHHSKEILSRESYAFSPHPNLDLAPELTHLSIKLVQSLQTVYTSATSPNSLPDIPLELLKYVDSGRNPDIYTREFVEAARKDNQLLKGRQEAFGSFRDIFCEEVIKSMPEMKEDMEKILEGARARDQGKEKRGGDDKGSS